MMYSKWNKLLLHIWGMLFKFEIIFLVKVILITFTRKILLNLIISNSIISSLMNKVNFKKVHCFHVAIEKVAFLKSCMLPNFRSSNGFLRRLITRFVFALRKLQNFHSIHTWQQSKQTLNGTLTLALLSVKVNRLSWIWLILPLIIWSNSCVAWPTYIHEVAIEPHKGNMQANRQNMNWYVSFRAYYEHEVMHLSNCLRWYVYRQAKYAWGKTAQLGPILKDFLTVKFKLKVFVSMWNWQEM